MKLKELFEAIEKSVADLDINYRGTNFSCSSANLTSLKGSPDRINGFFSCPNNKLTSLNGAPSYVMGHFNCSENYLTSLKDVHKQIVEIDGTFSATDNPIESHVLGLLLIKGITGIELDDVQVEEILNKHLGKGRAGMLQAQEELIEAGLEEFAQL